MGAQVKVCSGVPNGSGEISLAFISFGRGQSREEKIKQKLQTFFVCALFFDWWSSFFVLHTDKPVLQRAITFNELEILSAGRATCTEWSIENELTFITRSSKTITFSVACSLLSLFTRPHFIIGRRSSMGALAHSNAMQTCTAVHEINAFKWKALICLSLALLLVLCLGTTELNNFTICSAI